MKLFCFLRVIFGSLLLSASVTQLLAKQRSVAREWNEELLSAIRLSIPDPPAHARNLFHTAVAMYGAWAAYDEVSQGYLFHEKIHPRPLDLASARNVAINHAAYRILRNRFSSGVNSATILANIDARLVSLGHSPASAQSPASNTQLPADLGKRAADAILAWAANDGFSEFAHPQVYTTNINPNLDQPISALGTNSSFIPNMPLGFGVPIGTDPNLWQPLALSVRISQNGLPLTGGVQSFIGVQSLATTPFSLTRTDPTLPWMDPFGGPSRISMPDNPSANSSAYQQQALEVLISSSQLNDQDWIDLSPRAIGNNPLGTDEGEGFPVNPSTGAAYGGNLARRGDYLRVLAEYWADGPSSETPPGHWHLLANAVADRPDFERRLRGIGLPLERLEWDVKTYFALSAALHDAACAAWALKRHHSGPRPITMIRYLASLGQATDSTAASYHPQGLLLRENVCELITAASTSAGSKHHSLWDLATGTFKPGNNFIGQIAIYSWPGEHPSNPTSPGLATHQSRLTWMLAKDWLPFQRKTFNTPAFPGYVSGHSTFSRAAAEVLTLISGSPYFPGGIHGQRIEANSLQIDLGPSAPLELQWASYYDAADQAGQSRRYGGIHPPEDDYHGRVIGSKVGRSAFSLAEKYWNGTIFSTPVPTELTREDGKPALLWKAVRGMYQRVETSQNLIDWQPASPAARTYESPARWTDMHSTPAGTAKFYRVRWSATPLD